MSMFARIGAIVLGITWAGGAEAARIVGDGVNCRAAASATSRVVGTLRRGQEVAVLASRGGWSRVDPPRLATCWVRSDLLGEQAARQISRLSHSSARGVRTSDGYAAGLYTTPGRVSSPKKRTRSARKLSRPSGAYGGGSCPCSGGNICIGPRGGRYCITSGGNKRYGV